MLEATETTNELETANEEETMINNFDDGYEGDGSFEKILDNHENTADESEGKQLLDLMPNVEANNDDEDSEILYGEFDDQRYEIVVKKKELSHNDVFDILHEDFHKFQSPSSSSERDKDIEIENSNRL
jgi:hypothetical protein